jgi:hypothetical protein
MKQITIIAVWAIISINGWASEAYGAGKFSGQTTIRTEKRTVQKTDKKNINVKVKKSGKFSRQYKTK